MTARIVEQEQQIHELLSRLAAVETTERILENTSPCPRRSVGAPGRPPKTQE
jgi:hypothetical protein